MRFRYDDAILQSYSHLCGGVILARGLKNTPTPDALCALYQDEQASVVKRLADVPLSQVASLAGWRAAFRQFGIDPTQYRSAAEALLRRLTKKGDIPSINLLVDMGNLVSIRHMLPVAVFDTHSLTDAITVRVADGSERFTPLGETDVEHPEPGEVVFCDDTGLVVARRWCWRQSDESAARDSTIDAIITVEAQHERGQVDVEAALADLERLLRDYAGGTLTSGILSPARPELSDE